MEGTEAVPFHSVGLQPSDQMRTFGSSRVEGRDPDPDHRELGVLLQFHAGPGPRGLPHDPRIFPFG